MPITLTPEQERKLTAKAERVRKPVEVVLNDLLSDHAEKQNLIPEEAAYTIDSTYDCHEGGRIMQETINEEQVDQVKPTVITQKTAIEKGEPTKARNKAMLALLQKWSEEDEQMTDEEAEQALRDYEELRENLNLNRIRAREVPLYP